MVSDHERRLLYYEAAEQQLGPGRAATLMELLPPLGWSEVARQADLVAIRGEMAELRGEVAEVRGEVAEVRGEVAQLRAEVRSQLPRLIVANLASMIGLTGLVLAAAKLA